MKRIISLLLAALLMLAFTACDSENSTGNNDGNAAQGETNQNGDLSQEETVNSPYQVTKEQWEEIAFALNDIKPELVEDKPTLLQSLLKQNMLDGGLYRKLTFVYEDSTITYKWPQSDKANELEKIFEKLWA